MEDAVKYTNAIAFAYLTFAVVGWVALFVLKLNIGG